MSRSPIVPTRCPNENCGIVAAEIVCHNCKMPRPSLFPELVDKRLDLSNDDEALRIEDRERREEYRRDEDERLDDPRHGQARDLNRDCR